MSKIRIEIHLTSEETAMLDKIAEQESEFNSRGYDIELKLDKLIK